jgi:hypothetical protein
MALVSVPVTAGAASQKQLVFNVNNSGSVVYTVPAGKTFVGYYVPGATSSYISINGVSVYGTAGTAGYANVAIPLTLIAGTVLSGGSATGAVYGIES